MENYRPWHRKHEVEGPAPEHLQDVLQSHRRRIDLAQHAIENDDKSPFHQIAWVNNSGQKSTSSGKDCETHGTFNQCGIGPRNSGFLRIYGDMRLD